jgi:hypothetical protein
LRGEKNDNWEGGWRVPCAIRWPGVIKSGTVSNEVFKNFRSVARPNDGTKGREHKTRLRAPRSLPMNGL